MFRHLSLYRRNLRQRKVKLVWVNEWFKLMEFESAGSKWQKTWGQFQGKLHFFFEFTEFKVALQGSTVQCIFQAHAKSVLCKFM